jgi:hypothetical protein
VPWTLHVSPATWFETRGVAALLTMRVQDLTMRVQDLILRVQDLILRRREAPSRRMKPLNWKNALTENI